MTQLALDQRDQTMLEEVISLTRLHEAFRAVRAKGGAPGVDNVTVQRFAENLEQNLQHLAEEVRGWNYKPKPVKRVRIPMEANALLEFRVSGTECCSTRLK